jgi:hypothetical protein
MSGFTLGIAILGGLVLAGVIAYNTWMARRNTPRIAQPEEPVVQAPITSQEQIEPSLDADGFEKPLASKLSNDFESNLVPLGDNWVVDKKPLLDPLIDAMAPITVDDLVSGEAALAALPPTRRVGSKAFAIEGLNPSGQWEAPRAGQRYSAFQAGAQLASRTGALNEIEYSEFVQKAQGFADSIDGQAQFPEMRDEVARARELDAFASSHDAQLSFTLRAKNVAWSTGYVQQHAARQGFVAGSFAGRMVLPASTVGMPPILILNFDTQAALADDPEKSALRQLELALDVPQVERAEQAFARLRQIAIAMAQSMDAQITDAEGRPISREAMDAISADLEGLYDKLEARDLSAGSVQARRLFS